MKTMEPLTYKRVNNRSTTPGIKDKLSGISIAAAIIGLLISRGNILNCMAPLGMAWCAAMSCLPGGGIAVMLACGVGICLMDMGYVKLKYIAAIAIFAIIQKYYKTEKWEKKEFCIGMMCGISLFCSVVTMFFRGFLYYDLAVSIFEAAAVWASGIIFSKTTGVLNRNGQVISDEESIAVAIMAGAAVAGLQGINILGIKPANVLSMYIILFTAYKGGIGISGAVGAALGIISAMSQGDTAALTGVYAFVGLTAGIMNMFGKTGILAAAVCANAIFSAYYSSSAIIMINVFEIIIAGIGFYFTPDNVLEYIEKYSIKSEGYNPAKSQMLYERIKTAKAFAGLKCALSGMTKAFENIKTGNDDEKIAVICDRSAARVCDKCSLVKYCWTRNLKNTSALFENIATSLKNGTEEKVPEVIAGKCVRGELLANTVINLYNINRRENLIESYSEEFTQCAARQWDKLIGRVDMLLKDITVSDGGEEILSEGIGRALTLLGASYAVADVRKNEKGIYSVTVKTKNPIKFDITEPTENIIRKKMIIKNEITTDDGYITFMEEDTMFDYDIAVVTMDKMNTPISGDSYGHFAGENGVLSCVISDGMGSGEKAADESGLVIEIFRDLTEGGFSLGDTAQIINTGLINKNKGERCITLDCMNINLYNGKVQILKAGGAATVVKSGGETTLLRKASMPLGILNTEKFNEEFFEIENDTYFVMMTDGVPDNCGDRTYGEDWVRNIVSASSDCSAKEMADNIMMSAIANGKPRDDMMVMVVKIFTQKCI